jgi:alanine racemase
MSLAAYTVLDLDALKHNLAKVHEYAPDAKVMAVIKANAYGHGLFRVAEALEYADVFAVARVDEAMRLRQDGILNRIAVLEGFSCAEELNDIFQYRLEAVIHTEHQLGLLKEVKSEKTFSAWLKFDTGMNRLGFDRAMFDQAYQQLQQSNVIEKPIYLMTHLANADDLQDTKTQDQLKLFYEAVKSYSGELSIANSAGILGWPDALSDWVRPGLMLYGVSPFSGKTGAEFGLRPVMSLHSKIIATKQLEPGDAVGYGGLWRCQKPTLIGIIAIGYGDGYPRNVEQETPVLVNGIRVPLIGRVSMDMITVDLADYPDTEPGDPVTLWGKGLPVEEIAACADTIPYTLLCGITQRVKIIEQQQDGQKS